jgi:predicted transcriptional regulator of viral defense system
MTPLDAFLEQHLARGRITFTREEALGILPPNPLTAALGRLIRKGRLANPRQGFYLILTPADREQGAPDPARWIHPLMQHQKMDYRISLLSAARFHGAQQEPAAFQLVVPRPLRELAAGRHKLEFIHQAENAFIRTNRGEWLAELRSGSRAPPTPAPRKKRSEHARKRRA